MRRFALVRLPHYSRIFCRPVSLPLCSKGYIIAALADANRSASGVPVERWLLVILLRARYAPRAIRFLRCRYALSTFPPSKTRFVDCIGCDHAAYQRKERPCQTVKNQQPESAFTPCPRQSGGTKTPRATDHSTRSPFSVTTRTRKANGRAQTASTKVICSWPRRSSTWRIRRLSNSGPMIVRLSSQKIKPHSRPGQGALASALPFFSCCPVDLLPPRYQIRTIATLAAKKCLCTCSSPKPLTQRFSTCLQISRRRSDRANRTPVRLPRLVFRQAFLSGRADHSISYIPFLPSAKVEGNAERSSFRVSHIVSKLDYSVHGMHIILAVVVIFRFSLWMIRRHKTDSKLCASLSRHATGRRLSAVADGSTCKGASPRCIPSYRADEARRYA